MFSFFMPETPEQRARRRARQAEIVRERLKNVVPWSDTIRWEKELNIDASTYKPPMLFSMKEVPPSTANDPQGRRSKDKKWLYANLELPAGQVLDTYNGSRRGSVVFDGPVIIPALYEEGRLETPWMSLTPMELLTLRPGTRLAKGHTIVVGMGLGHQLIEVSKRKQVTKLTLVERDKNLVDFLMPRIVKQMKQHADIIIGDARQVLPTLTADVALIDIFPGYGSNKWECDRFTRSARGIKRVWCWGSPSVG